MTYLVGQKFWSQSGWDLHLDQPLPTCVVVSLLASRLSISSLYIRNNIILQSFSEDGKYCIQGMNHGRVEHLRLPTNKAVAIAVYWSPDISIDQQS